MFNMGFSELILLGAIALIFIGPNQLPEVAKTLGKLLNEWKRATSDLTSSFTDNEAFRDWEARRQNYLAEAEKEKMEKENVEKNVEANGQLEMNLEQNSEKESGNES